MYSDLDWWADWRGQLDDISSVVDVALLGVATLSHRIALLRGAHAETRLVRETELGWVLEEINLVPCWPRWLLQRSMSCGSWRLLHS